MFGVVMFVCAIVSASRLPKGKVAPSAQPAEKLELRNASLRSAAVAMSLIRAVVGFMFFELRSGCARTRTPTSGSARSSVLRHSG